MTLNPPRICILGGGFGGLYTALRLSQLPWSEQQPQIHLVDQNDHFLFTPLLYELVTGELQAWEIAPPFSEVLAHTGIRFIQAGVERIDPDQRVVELDQGPSLSYDRLVLALGGETPHDQVPGAADHALPFRTVADAYRLEEQLRTLEATDKDPIKVAVVGAGPSGVELTCKLADRLGERGLLRLIDRGDHILETGLDFNRRAAHKALASRTVWISLNTTVNRVEPDQITLDANNKVETTPIDLVLWTVGTAIAAPIAHLSLPHHDQGQLRTEQTLQVTGHPNIFALGDVINCEDAQGQAVPKTAQVALQQADCVGWNVWASLSDRPRLPFRYSPLGEMLTLGQDAAAMAGLGLELEGPFAHVARRLIYLYRMPTLDHQLKVGLNWILKPMLSAMTSSP